MSKPNDDPLLVFLRDRHAEVYAAGQRDARNSIANYFQKLADDYAQEHGSLNPQTEGLAFSNYTELSYHSALLEFEKTIRASSNDK